MFAFFRRLWPVRLASKKVLEPSGPPLLDLIRGWDGGDDLALPDDDAPPGWNVGDIRFANGAYDGILLNHVAPPERMEIAERTRELVDAVETVTKSLADPDMERLYRLARGDALITYGDAVIEALRARDSIDSERLWAVGRWLIETARHREPLKLGIMILSLGATDEDVATLKTLGRHDEFTLFAAVAIGNLCDAAADHWLDLARTVRGWGKIHLVERLAGAAPTRPDIRDWLLREGCSNDVEDSYLAYLCATAGNLAGALAAESLDDELLDGCCTITLALLEGGPSEDIRSYEEGAVAIGHLLHHLAGRCTTIHRLYAVVRISEWLRWLRLSRIGERANGDAGPDAADLERLETHGWTRTVRRELLGQCERILRDPDWPDRLRAAYAGAAEPAATLAHACAEVLRVDLWNIAMARLKKAPHAQRLYIDLLRTGDRRRRQTVMSFAERHLPLAKLGAGPALELGLGDDWELSGCLDVLLQEMARRGPYHEVLAATGLRSPVIRHRLHACAVLAGRAPESWGDRVEAALQVSLTDEPDEDVRKELETLGKRLTEGGA